MEKYYGQYGGLWELMLIYLYLSWFHQQKRDVAGKDGNEKCALL